jgi:CelD/BcsL family acetyltransferase involved in cellulose biosynthesis
MTAVATTLVQTMPTALTTEVITDHEAFLGLERQWNETVARAAVPHPFLRHEWFRTWWECFGLGRRLYLVVVRNADRIVAIAPLMFEQVHLYGLPIRKIDLLHNDHTPRADFIVAESAVEAYDAIWCHLDAIRSHWDLVQLSRLPAGSATIDAIEALAWRGARATGRWRGDVSPFLTLSDTWEHYYASLPAKFRSNLRNRLTRLGKFGEPRLEILEDQDAIAGAREDALRLEASGWKAESGTSICSDPATERFYTLLSERATANRWLRLMFLTVGGRRIATSYGARFAQRLFLFKTGYDPEYATCSPFKLLTYFAIQSAYDEGLTELDFLGDAEPWKREWTGTARSHDWLFVFSDSVRARLLHSLKFQVVPELRRWRA